MSSDLTNVAHILNAIANPANLRSQRRGGDLQGDFDQWFDGGAMKIVTGSTEYRFADGAEAIIPTTPHLRIHITLPDGGVVNLTWGERPSLDDGAV